MNAPQIIWIAWHVFVFGLACHKHGRDVTVHAPTTALFMVGELAVLWWGGFFSQPQ